MFSGAPVHAGDEPSARRGFDDLDSRRRASTVDVSEHSLVRFFIASRDEARCRNGGLTWLCLNPGNHLRQLDEGFLGARRAAWTADVRCESAAAAFARQLSAGRRSRLIVGLGGTARDEQDAKDEGHKSNSPAQ